MLKDAAMPVLHISYAVKQTFFFTTLQYTSLIIVNTDPAAVASHSHIILTKLNIVLKVFNSKIGIYKLM